jgi:hypothetical protein
MESAPEIQFRPVHVLHHRFRMSANLIAAAKILMKDEGRAEPFQLLATKRITLDKAPYYNGTLDGPLQTAVSRFTNYTDPIYFSDEIQITEINNGQSRLTLHPRLQSRFDELLATANNLPDINPQPRGRQHSLFIVARTAVLLSGMDQRRAMKEVSERLVDREEGRLHSATPLELTGYDFTLQQTVPKDPNQEHADLKSA